MENLNKWEKNTSLLQFYLMPVNVQNMIYHRATPESPIVNKNDLITLFILLPPNNPFLKIKKIRLLSNIFFQRNNQSYWLL